MYKYKVLSLTFLFFLTGMASSQAVSDGKNLQYLDSSEAIRRNPSQVDPEHNSLASEAGKEFSDGAKGLGRGFVKGAQVTGGAFKKAGTTMGHGFKRAGSAIRGYFAGKPDIEERDLHSEEYETIPASPRRPSEDLDAVGNDLPRTQPQRLSRESYEEASRVN